MKKRLLLLPVLFAALSFNAQQFYQRTFSGAAYAGVHQYDSGEFLVIGQKTRQDPTGVMQKFSSSGELIKSETFASGGSGISFFGATVNHPISFDGDQLLISVYSSGLSGNTSVYPGLIKMDAEGDVLWHKIYNNAAVTGGINTRGGTTATIKDNDGNYISSGWFNSMSQGTFNYFNLIQKTDPDGNVIWRKDYSSAFVFASDILQTEDGNYLVLAGQSAGTYLTLFDKDGNKISDTRYGIGTIYPVANKIIKTTDGGYLIVGTVSNANGYLLKINADLSVSWSKTYDKGGYTDIFNNAVATSDGGFLIVGETKANSTANSDGLMIKADNNGNILWSKTFGRVTNDILNDVVETSDGYFAVGQSGANDNSDGWIIHTDKDGNADGCDEYPATITTTSMVTAATATTIYLEYSSTGALDEPVVKADYTATKVLPYDITINAEATTSCKTGNTLIKLDLVSGLATAYWTTTGTGKIYTDENGTTEYDGTTKVHTVYVLPDETQTYTAESCKLSDSVEITVTETAAPTGNSNYLFCDSAKLSDITLNGENIIWYDAATGGNVLADSTELSDGTTYYASQTVNGCESIARFEVFAEEDCSLSVNDTKSKGIIIYPNPVKDIAYVSNEVPVEMVQVYDLSGGLIKEFKTGFVKRAEINLSNLKEGVYILSVKIQGESSKKIFKIIKK